MKTRPGSARSRAEFTRMASASTNGALNECAARSPAPERAGRSDTAVDRYEAGHDNTLRNGAHYRLFPSPTGLGGGFRKYPHESRHTRSPCRRLRWGGGASCVPMTWLATSDDVGAVMASERCAAQLGRASWAAWRDSPVDHVSTTEQKRDQGRHEPEPRRAACDGRAPAGSCRHCTTQWGRIA